jgi:AcrR family transcriptional regulator
MAGQATTKKPAAKRAARRLTDRSARGLDRAAILEAASRLLDERGLHALTMRALARELGVAPMTVYWHVGDREELLDALVADALDHVAVRPPDAGSWSERMMSVLADLRGQLLRHSRVIPLLARHRRLAPAVITAGEGVLALAVELGLDERETVRVFRAAMWHTLGSVFVESFLSERELFGEPSVLRSAFDRADSATGDDDHAMVRRLERELTTFDADDLFRYSTARLLEGLRSTTLFGQPMRTSTDGE